MDESKFVGGIFVYQSFASCEKWGDFSHGAKDYTHSGYDKQIDYAGQRSLTADDGNFSVVSRFLYIQESFRAF